MLVFYDGECPFCVGWVKFLLDRDGDNRLRFASLQGDWARDFFRQRELEHPGMGSIVVWDGTDMYREMAAISRIGEVLPGIWRGFRFLERFPSGLRDGLYRFVAKHRYTVFGRYERCWLPQAGDRKKFLDQ